MEIGILKDVTQAPQCDYQMVDLGLPSGIKWADRNVGATTPQDYGMYFSWGNTKGVLYEGIKNMSVIEVAYKCLESEGTPHSEIISQVEQLKQQYGENWEQVVLEMLIQGGISSFIEGTTFDWETAPYYSGVDDNGNPLFSKYNGTDGITVLEAIDDAATVIMGDDWRMPTSTETRELHENTDHYYIDLSGNTVAGPFNYGTSSSDKGLDGSKLRSICFVKKGEVFDYNNRSNFIEFPFAGRCFGSLSGNDGLHVDVWSSSVRSGNNEVEVEILSCESGGYIASGANNSHAFSSRCYGLSVRGVRA